MSKRVPSTGTSPFANMNPRWREELRIGREIREFREGRQTLSGTRSRLGTPYIWNRPRGS
jgi:hypothetical protein